MRTEAVIAQFEEVFHHYLEILMKTTENLDRKMKTLDSTKGSGIFEEYGKLSRTRKPRLRP
jgi:hypothetical protein